MKENSTIDTLKTLEKFYVDKKFDAGVDYLIDHKTELPVGKFHYYFGSFQLKLGNLAVGKYHLKLAVKNGFIQHDVFHNLDVVNTKLEVQKVEESLPIKDKILFSSLNLHSDWYLILTLAVVLLFFFSYWKEWVIKKRWIIVGVLLAALPYTIKLSWVDNHQFAIALKQADVREGPSSLYEVSGQLPAGLTLIIGRFYNGQVYIEAPNQYSGWVKKENLGVF